MPAKISHDRSFNYLAAENGVRLGPLFANGDEIRFEVHSGIEVRLQTRNMVINDQTVVSGQVTQIAFWDGVNIVATISDLSLPLKNVTEAFQYGTGIPRIFSGNNELEGSQADDILEGYAGNDILIGLAGADLIGGGAGDDLISAGLGDDTIFGGDGFDKLVISGNYSDWFISFSKGNASLTSHITGEIDTLSGIESLIFDDLVVDIDQAIGIMAISDGVGPVIFGTAARDNIIGGAGADFLWGGTSENTLEYNSIFGDTMAGGAGDDIYFASARDEITEAQNGGQDHINLVITLNAISGHSYVLPDNVESVSPVSATIDLNLFGNRLDNRIFGAQYDDHLSGLAGDDELHGAGGNDILSGGGGNDILFAAAGDDILKGNNDDDQLFGGSGNDILIGGNGDDIIHGDDRGSETSTPQHFTDEDISGQVANGMNILFVSIDDLAPVFSIFPNALYQAVAPNLDAFFDRSTVFTNAHATAPLCNASRASVMLGVSPDTSGISTNTDSLVAARSMYQSLPSFLQENGYETILSGKIFHDTADRGDPASWTQSVPESRRLDWTPTSWERSDTDISLALSPDVPDTAFGDGRLVQHLSEFVTAEHNDPFFYAFGQFRPHAPQYVPQEYFDLYPLESIEIPDLSGQDLADLSEIGRAIANNLNPGVQSTDELLKISPLTNEMAMKLAIQGYLASVSYADTVFGEALDALQTSAHANNTAVVLWSDHGFHLGDKLHFSKFTLWEQGTKAPLAIMLPGQTEGAVVDKAVSLMDIYSTVSDMVGLTAPGHVQGHSLQPLLEDPNAAWDHPSLTEFNGNYSVRSNDYRYIRYWDGSEELYVNSSDPAEQNNVANDPAYALQLIELAKFLPGGDDRILGGAGNDQLFGWSGDDYLDGGSGDDIMHGGVGNDRYVLRDAGDVIVENAGEGIDIVKSHIDYTLGDNVEALLLFGGARIGTGNALDNTISGRGSSDTLSGLAGNDIIRGNNAADIINGGTGNDLIDGGQGKDIMTGGEGKDRFQFRFASDFNTTVNSADVITDFNQAEGDDIQLNAIDANTGTGTNDAFEWISTNAFSSTAGEMRYEQIAGDTFIEGDTDGDGQADLMIRLTGLYTLDATDIIGASDLQPNSAPVGLSRSLDYASMFDDITIQEADIAKMRIWMTNPFHQLPGETLSARLDTAVSEMSAVPVTTVNEGNVIGDVFNPEGPATFAVAPAVAFEGEGSSPRLDPAALFDAPMPEAISLYVEHVV